jgi:hypothetical protein
MVFQHGLMSIPKKSFTAKPTSQLFDDILPRSVNQLWISNSKCWKRYNCQESGIDFF